MGKNHITLSSHVYGKLVDNQSILIRARCGLYSHSTDGFTQFSDFGAALAAAGMGCEDPGVYYGYRMINLEILDFVATRDERIFNEGGFWPVANLNEDTRSAISVQVGMIQGFLSANDKRIEIVP